MCVTSVSRFDCLCAISLSIDQKIYITIGVSPFFKAYRQVVFRGKGGCLVVNQMIQLNDSFECSQIFSATYKPASFGILGYMFNYKFVVVKKFQEVPGCTLLYLLVQSWLRTTPPCPLSVLWSSGSIWPEFSTKMRRHFNSRRDILWCFEIQISQLLLCFLWRGAV